MITKEQLEKDLQRKSPAWWQSVSQFVGKENYYFDKGCGFGIVTIDRDAGVTPMHLRCRNPKNCSGVMQSMCYPHKSAKPAYLGDPTHEWYRPETIDDDAENDESDHLMNGGLLLRSIDVS